MTKHSYDPPQPDPSCRRRARKSRRVRRAASRMAANRPNVGTLRNGEAELYEGTWPTNFTKGLPHDRFGSVDPEAFKIFFDALNAKPCSKDARFEVPLGPLRATKHYRPTPYTEDPDSVETFCVRRNGNPKEAPAVRAWESPRAGHAYDLEGPDADAVAMPPAPCLGSEELTAEMAEVYAMALLRDLPITAFGTDHATACEGGQKVRAQQIVDELNKLAWFDGDQNIPGLRIQELRRRRARFAVGKNRLSVDSIFRGSAPGAKDGPLVSQFLLVGSPLQTDPGASRSQKTAYQIPAASTRQYAGESTWDADDPCAGTKSGLITYGTLAIDQRSTTHKECLDYMTGWHAWLDVHNGADLRGSNRWQTRPGGQDLLTKFLTTPRDLATYVHFDALYQAYLNACLLMASYGASPAAGVPSGATHSTRDSFATFGIPHVLSLVTEVATRALKAVRRQKFQYHLRARPEAIGGILTLAKNGVGLSPEAGAAARQNVAELDSTQLLEWISRHNAWQNQPAVDAERVFRVPEGGEGCVEPPYDEKENNVLLPMAFPEGSPMHATYGAGHATVAGACVTILKAFFELHKDPRPAGSRDPLGPNYKPVDYRDERWWQTKLCMPDLDSCFAKLFVPTKDGSELVADGGSGTEITIIGELNKLAANISIARNMAGVHYYSDYYDSLRLGERVAAGILQEQMLTYPDTMSMRFESFDGDHIVFQNTCGRASGLTDVVTYVQLATQDGNGNFGPAQGEFKEEHWDTWWCRPSDDLENACGDANPDEPCFGRGQDHHAYDDD